MRVVFRILATLAAALLASPGMASVEESVAPTPVASSEPAPASAPAVAGPVDIAMPTAPTGTDASDLEKLLATFDTNYAEARDALSGPLREYSPERMAELEELRSRMAKDRDTADALAARGSVSTRVLNAQIATLGPVPAEGLTEPAAVTERRELLETRLGSVMTPIMRLREASARASVMVDEIDQRLRRLTNRQLFERGFSPLNPTLWFRAARDVTSGSSAMATNFAQMKAKYGSEEMTVATLIALVLLGLTPLLVLGLRRKLFAWLDRKLEVTPGMARRMMLTLSRDSMAGFVLLVASILAAIALAILGSFIVPMDKLLLFAVAIVMGGFIVATGEWLGRSALRSPFPQLRLLTLPADRLDAGVTMCRRMSELLAIEVVIDALERDALISTSIARLLSAVVVIAGAWLVWKLAQMLQDAHRYAREQRESVLAGDELEHAKSRIDFTTPIARLIRAVAIAAVAITLVGYVLLAREIFTSTLLTLGLLGTALYTHRTIGLVVTAAAEGPLSRYRRILHFVPLMFGFAMVVLLLPLVAIIWGYSAYEIWDGILTLRNGVDFGEVRISFGDVMTFIAVFLFGYFVTRWLQRFLDLAILPEFGMERGVQSALVTGIGYIGVVLAAVVAIASTGLDLSSLAFVAGALSVGLGFGLQAVIENFTSGILLLVERPVREGDWIEVGEHQGIVKKIAVRSTHIETFDRHQIIIPNSQLITEAVKNRSLAGGAARIIVPVGVGYGTDLDGAKAALLDIAASHQEVLADPAPGVAMDGFGDSAINLKLLAFVGDVNRGGPVQSDLLMMIAREFAAKGIEIPFPQRDLNIRTWPQVQAAEPDKEVKG